MASYRQHGSGASFECDERGDLWRQEGDYVSSSLASDSAGWSTRLPDRTVQPPLPPQRWPDRRGLLYSAPTAAAAAYDDDDHVPPPPPPPPPPQPLLGRLPPPPMMHPAYKLPYIWCMVCVCGSWCHSRHHDSHSGWGERGWVIIASSLTHFLARMWISAGSVMRASAPRSDRDRILWASSRVSMFSRPVDVMLSKAEQ